MKRSVPFESYKILSSKVVSCTCEKIAFNLDEAQDTMEEEVDEDVVTLAAVVVVETIMVVVETIMVVVETIITPSLQDVKSS